MIKFKIVNCDGNVVDYQYKDFETFKQEWVHGEAFPMLDYRVAAAEVDGTAILGETFDDIMKKIGEMCDWKY